MNKQLKYNGEKVNIRYGNYQNNGRLAVSLTDEEDYPYATITTNLVDYNVSGEDCAFVDTNNMGHKVMSWLADNGLAEWTGRMGSSGFCDYPEFRFLNIEKPKDLFEEI